MNALDGPSAGSIIIDGKVYFLAKNKAGAPLWRTKNVPTKAGDPMAPRWKRYNDWSRGLGDSRGFIDGAVEYAENAYLGGLGRILPSPAVTIIDTNLGADVTCFQDVTAPANRVLAGGGTKVAEINPSTQAVATTATLSGSVASMALFIDQVAIAVGDSTNFYRRNASGTYSQNSISFKARAFGISDSRLVRGRDAYWSSCSAADFYGTSGNWSAESDIGDLSGKITQVFAHNRFDYVLKEEGLYSFDDDTGQESNQLEDLRAFKSAENRYLFRWGDLMFVCTLAGLYRYLQQSAARTVGLEEVTLNESELLGYPTAGAAFGKWAYVAYYKPSSGVTYVCMMRRAQQGDASMGSPFTLTSVLYKFTGLCRAMHVSSLPTSPTLYFGKGDDVGYLTLTRDGLPAAYQTGSTTVVRFPPDDLASPMTVKSLRSIEVFGKNVSASKAITFKASVDHGSDNAVGAAIESLAAGYAQRFWTNGSNDAGRVVQLVAELTNDSASVPPEIREVQLNYEERPTHTTAYETILLARDQWNEGDYADDRHAALVRSDIDALLESGPVTVIGPDGESFTARISGWEAEIDHQYRGDPPQENIPVQIRRVDYS